jgi:hypothetical protein
VKLLSDLDLKRMEGDWFTTETVNMSHFAPLSCIHSVCLFDQGELVSDLELNIGSHKWVVTDIHTRFADPIFETFLFDESLRISGGTLLTDYDNFGIDYACFDGMRL